MAKKVGSDFFDDVISDIQNTNKPTLQTSPKPSSKPSPKPESGGTAYLSEAPGKTRNFIPTFILLGLIAIIVIFMLVKKHDKKADANEAANAATEQAQVMEEQTADSTDTVADLLPQISDDDDTYTSEEETYEADSEEEYSYDSYNDSSDTAEYDTVVTEAVPEVSESDFQFYVTVKASDGGCNFRSGPGVEYDKLQNQMIPNGIQLGIIEVKNSTTGKPWGYTRYSDRYGWIALSQTDYGN